jgi:hypothetical protein
MTEPTEEQRLFTRGILEMYGYEDAVAEIVARDAAQFNAGRASRDAELRDLAAKWLDEQMSYPSTPEGLHAAASVRCCVRELLALLAGQAARPGATNFAPAYCTCPVHGTRPLEIPNHERIARERGED